MKWQLVLLTLSVILVAGCVQQGPSDLTPQDQGPGQPETPGSSETPSQQVSIQGLGGSCTSNTGCYYIECKDGSAAYCMNTVKMETEKICVTGETTQRRDFISVSGDPKCGCVNSVCTVS